MEKTRIYRDMVIVNKLVTIIIQSIMKKLYFLTLPFLAAALWSCTDKNDLGGDNNPDRDIAANYLSVSIVPAMETGTRVDGNTGDNGGKYKDGNAIENYVKNVRFYFFDAAGNAQNVKRTEKGWNSYYDVYKPDSTKGTKPNVEKVINATIVLETPNGDLFPASLVAIVNYDKDLFGGKDIDASSIDKLLKQTGQFAKSSYGEEEGILMSNSVYKETNGTSQIVERKLAPENFGKDKGEAEAHPVTIYVERAVAKVSLSTDEIQGFKPEGSGPASGKRFPVLTANDEQLTIRDKNKEEDTAIYVKILGWNVTQTADKSFAVKNLDSDWVGNSPFGGWTCPAYFRSFWALNPTDVQFKYTDFDGSNDNPGIPAGNAILGISDKETNTPNYTYAPENAPQEENDKRTEVIVAAQLVDSEGSAIKLADFGGMKFMGENYTKDLLQYVANILGVWKKTPVDGGSSGFKYETIQDDLKLVSAQEARETKEGFYYTYVQFTTDASSNEYVDNNDGTGKEVKFTELKEKLSNLPFIKVWTNGYTYYFVDIEHLNNADGPKYPVGKYGVVRNHWYAIDVTKIYGLGTPVFDPSEEIIPENPQDHETYLAAKINILSWRLVNQNTTLGQK